MPPNVNMDPRPGYVYSGSSSAQRQRSHDGPMDGVTSSPARPSNDPSTTVVYPPRYSSQGVVASHFLAQGGESWMDFLSDGTEPTVNRHNDAPAPEPRPQPSSTSSSSASASASASRYTLPSRASQRTESHSSDRKRRLTTADSPMRRPSSIRMHSDNGNPGNTSQDPIVLDMSPALPPLPRSAEQGSGLERRQSDLVLPQWQPDSEVEKCPVCRRGFTFMYRKHHCRYVLTRVFSLGGDCVAVEASCAELALQLNHGIYTNYTGRKCGRVVCSSCSPHRITIPRQFIVHPPTDSTIQNIIDLTGDDEAAIAPFGSFRNPALGGGEEVRVCNPCVPDPNPNPPPQYNPPHLSRHQFPSFSRPSYAPLPPPPHPRAQRSSTGGHSASQAVGHGQAQRPRDPFGTSSGDHRRLTYHGGSTPSERWLPPLPGTAIQPPRTYHHDASLSRSITTINSHTTPFPPGSGPPRSILTPVAPPLLPQHAQPPRSRRQVAEEDECPICGNELPPKGPNNDDADRTQHIQECIALHSASPPPIPLTQQTSASLPTQRTRGMSSAGGGSGGGGGASNNAEASSASRLSHAARGMFPYIATEKDCTDDEGREAECIICLEDFEAGERMARLVCWCKFHEVCFLSRFPPRPVLVGLVSCDVVG